MRARTLAFYSVKGGVGKTAASVNVAYEATRDGFKTILCDLDPQGAASFYFRIRPPKRHGPRALIKGAARLSRAIRGTDFESLDVLPSSFSLRKLDIQLDRVKRSKKRLREALDPLTREYDLVLLDCPPSMTLVSENVFRASDYVVVPCVPTTLSMMTFEKLQDFFRKQKLKRSKILAFFSMVEARKKLQRDVMNRLNRNERYFMNTRIPYLAEIERMGLERKPVACYSPTSLAATRYTELWCEIRQRTMQPNHRRSKRR
jgi:cellulose biosynthesis protein BcsQ